MTLLVLVNSRQKTIVNRFPRSATLPTVGKGMAVEYKIIGLSKEAKEINKKTRTVVRVFLFMAPRTGLEPVTS